jgi:hypothetical protein
MLLSRVLPGGRCCLRRGGGALIIRLGGGCCMLLVRGEQIWGAMEVIVYLL